MKFILLTFLIPMLSFSSPIRPGNYFGTGSFSCFFINSKILRPLSSHWQIRVKDTYTDSFEFIGNYPIVNSQPVYFVAQLKEKTNLNSNYVLFDEEGKNKGNLNCHQKKCTLKFKFISNLAKNIRTSETIKLVWDWNEDTFKEEADLSYTYLPLIGTCKSNSSYSIVD